MSLIAQDVYNIMGQPAMKFYKAKVSYLGLLFHVDTGGDIFAEPNLDGTWQVIYTDEHAKKLSLTYPDPIALVEYNTNLFNYRKLTDEENRAKACHMFVTDVASLAHKVAKIRKEGREVSNLLVLAPRYCLATEETYQED